MIIPQTNSKTSALYQQSHQKWQNKPRLIHSGCFNFQFGFNNNKLHQSRIQVIQFTIIILGKLHVKLKYMHHKTLERSGYHPFCTKSFFNTKWGSKPSTKALPGFFSREWNIQLVGYWLLSAPTSTAFSMTCKRNLFVN